MSDLLKQTLRGLKLLDKKDLETVRLFLDVLQDKNVKVVSRPACGQCGGAHYDVDCPNRATKKARKKAKAKRPWPMPGTMAASVIELFRHTHNKMSVKDLSMMLGNKEQDEQAHHAVGTVLRRASIALPKEVQREYIRGDIDGRGHWVYWYTGAR